MNRPKMIIFDAGKTLIDYKEINTLKGVKALMPYIIQNPRKLSAEEIDTFTNEIFAHYEDCRKNLFEIHEQTILKTVYDLLELKFSITLSEIEEIIWNETPLIEPVEHVEELLDFLNASQIKTAVISNFDFSGYLLKKKLDELFKNNQFRFVIASSDYGIRKPDIRLFKLGILKSSFEPHDIWYVGDKVNVDVKGSHNAGMVSILYKNKSAHDDAFCENALVIEDYRELIRILKGVEI